MVELFTFSPAIQQLDYTFTQTKMEYAVGLTTTYASSKMMVADYHAGLP
jgi:hypothetical protein